MKLSDLLKKLGINLEQDVSALEEKEEDEKLSNDGKEENADTSDNNSDQGGGNDSKNAGTSEKNDDDLLEKSDNNLSEGDGKDMAVNANNDNVNNVNNSQTSDNTNVTPTPMLEPGWFNPETLQIDESKVHNQEILNALKALKGEIDRIKLQYDIDNEINKALEGLKLTVNKATFKKLLDLSNVTRDKDGNIVGIKEAIEKLRAEEPGLFAKEDPNDNPLKQGFNPVKSASNKKLSLEEAWQLRNNQ